MEERYEGQCIGWVGKQSEVYEELVLGTYLQIISGFGLSVSHGVFFHAHEGGIRIGLGVGVAFSISKSIKMVVVFHQLVTVLLKFPDLFLLFPDDFLLFLVLCYRLAFQHLFKFIHYI